MSAVEWYGVIVGALFLLSIAVLHRLNWPGELKSRFAAAAGIALAWPLALPMLSFGSVAIFRLAQTQPRTPGRKRDAAAVPAA